MGWIFDRPSPPHSTGEYFRSDFRQVAGQQKDYNLPWDDAMYLAYPSPGAASWPEFVQHANQLNSNCDARKTQYKIIYVIRRAHKSGERGVLDPPLDDSGKEQCGQLAERFAQAMRDAHIPPPEAIVTSPLRRALETTKFGIAPLFPSVHPIALESLREKMMGVEKTARLDLSSIQQNFPEFDVSNVDANDQLQIEFDDCGTEESAEDVKQRVLGAFEFIFENLSHASVVMLMSHCRVQQVIQREITGWDLPVDKREEAEFYVGEAQGYAIIVKGTKS